MEQLSGLDASYLNIETATFHGHAGTLAIFGASAPAMTFETVKKTVAERIQELPAYRRRLVNVPLGIDRPYWVEDEHFALDFHIRPVVVPSPGERHQLADLIGELHAHALDRAKPLWEMYVIEGLADGGVALYTKIHTACVLGNNGAELLSTLLDPDPEGREVTPEVVPWSPDRTPSNAEMLSRGLLALASQPRTQWRLQRQLIRSGLRATSKQVGPTLGTIQEALQRTPGLSALVPSPKPNDTVLSRPSAVAPRLSFNRSISAARRFAYGSLSFDDVKRVKDTGDYTVNDVLMAICAGGLRKWLGLRQELPTDPLLAMIPVSVPSGNKSGEGNQILGMIAPLASNESSPMKRLQLAHEAMSIAKTEHAALPANLLQDFGRFAPPAVSGQVARLLARTKLTDKSNPPFNLVISNIPGPQHPLYSNGSRQVASYPVPLLTNGAGLNITLASYDGRVDVGLIACREAVDDLWSLMDSIERSAASLLRTATEQADTA
nr:putative wax ester synthase/acyl-CoA:diacylglycerol acyltransferase [uncultured bacterium]